MQKCEKINKKLDAIFWWLIWLLPLLGAFICFALGSDNTFAEFSSFIEGFSFDFVYELIFDLQSAVSISFPSILVAYASYLVSVEILHVFVDVMVFIPRFAHGLVDLDTYTQRRIK